MLKGVLTAIVTPFKNSAVDGKALRSLVARQLEAGVHGIVVCGTTGEAAALTQEERLLVIETVLEEVQGRVPVIAGTGSNNTEGSVQATRSLLGHKLDGVLVVTPYYVKPTQAGLVAHFREVASVGVPVVAYNVPGRTGVSLTPETVAELSEISGIVAIKEATGDLKLDAMMVQAARNKLTLLSGDDFTFLPFLSIGGKGCISVVSNVAPRHMVELFDAWEKADTALALSLHLQLLGLMNALFLESNPIPVKAALAQLDLLKEEIRLPLLPLSAGLRPRLQQELTRLGLLRGGL